MLLLNWQFKKLFKRKELLIEAYNRQHTPGSYGKVKKPAIAYRKNEEEILKGNPPEKYTRILPFVPGNRVLEIGAAESVLSLLLARTKEMVYALDKSEYRIQKGKELQKTWRKLGYSVDNCRIIHGGIEDQMDLLDDVDTIIAVRVIYHFREEIDLDELFRVFAKKVKHVVLVGNKDKSNDFYRLGGDFETSPIPFNYYATAEGMVALLERNGFTITEKLTEGDPIVTGTIK